MDSMGVIIVIGIMLLINQPYQLIIINLPMVLDTQHYCKQWLNILVIQVMELGVNHQEVLL
tara:strand:+ start:281 stop:463 length:183 start_codon:yes stop_codon:yes gene_type:complete